MSKQEVLKNHIQSLLDAIPDLTGVLLTSTEGLPIAHSLANGTDPGRVAAMAAAALSLGRRITDAIQAGSVAEVTVRAGEGDLFVYSAGSKVVLAVLGPKNSNAGLILLEARNTAAAIAALFA
jgi:predicted regulator of Ras-like GTPase activity (Roadblock/LC7/MglB family)